MRQVINNSMEIFYGNLNSTITVIMETSKAEDGGPTV